MFGILWFALFIPVMLCVVLLSFPKLRIKTQHWELAIPILVSILTVVICQYVAIRSATNDTEYWGHMGVTATHQEPAAYEGECSERYACGQT